MPGLPLMLRVREAAALLGLTETMVRGLIRQGRLHAIEASPWKGRRCTRLGLYSVLAFARFPAALAVAIVEARLAQRVLTADEWAAASRGVWADGAEQQRVRDQFERAARLAEADFGEPPAGFAWNRYGRLVVDVLPGDGKLSCPECRSELEIRPGRWGAFVGCSGYPECRFRAGLRGEAKAMAEKMLGDAKD
jgi:hypothetical protein